MVKRFLLVLTIIALAACGDGDGDGDGDKNTTSASDAPNSAVPDFGRPTVPARVAQGWIVKWCDVSPGDSRAEVRETMGDVTNDFGDQDQWEAFNLSFVAFYDSHDVAIQLQTDTQQWTAEDRAALTCEDTRRI